MTTSSRTSSAGRWFACVDRQLSVEGTLVGGPRFAAGYIGGEVRIFVQHTRRFQPEQHRHHHQVARAERAIEPVGIAKATGKLDQPVTDAILDERHASYPLGAPLCRPHGIARTVPAKPSMWSNSRLWQTSHKQTGSASQTSLPARPTSHLVECSGLQEEKVPVDRTEIAQVKIG